VVIWRERPANAGLRCSGPTLMVRQSRAHQQREILARNRFKNRFECQNWSRAANFKSA
jgi:hypothetical protein